MVANKLTANYASIANSNFSGGAIVGSSINVGDGRFVVNSAGSVFAADGTFQGTINARGGRLRETFMPVERLLGVLSQVLDLEQELQVFTQGWKLILQV